MFGECAFGIPEVCIELTSAFSRRRWKNVVRQRLSERQDQAEFARLLQSGVPLMREILRDFLEYCSYPVCRSSEHLLLDSDS
jgi:hypothetical protein